MFRFTLSERINTEGITAGLPEFPGMDTAESGLSNVYRTLFSCLDYTTLDGTDNRKKVEELCRKAVGFGEKGLPLPAAVCIYPPFVSTARKYLQGTSIRVATTAAAFPSGQMALKIKLQEVEYVVGEGADEVDIVISRGTFLEENYQEVFDEISEIKSRCGQAALKVILETGELKTAVNIARASEIAILAGADFIKTSTGKVVPAATPEAAGIMSLVIREHFLATGQKTGLKPAGGIAEPGQAMEYYKIVSLILGPEWVNPSLFRIGASRLADNIAQVINP